MCKTAMSLASHPHLRAVESIAATAATTKGTDVCAGSSAIIVQELDVLAGRGAKSNRHLGNKLFRSLVKQNRGLYQQLKDNNAHKTTLAESIIASIHARGGRFLKQQRHSHCRQTTSSSVTSTVWYELTKEEAITKTQQALREIPPGTSSRALNVERVLEKKRMMAEKSKTPTPNTMTPNARGLPKQTRSKHLDLANQGEVSVDASTNEQPSLVRTTTSVIEELMRAPIMASLGGGRGDLYLHHEQQQQQQQQQESTQEDQEEQETINLSDDEIESLLSDSDAVLTLSSLLE